jgi:hypothetical protein
MTDMSISTYTDVITYLGMKKYLFIRAGCLYHAYDTELISLIYNVDTASISADKEKEYAKLTNS